MTILGNPEELATVCELIGIASLCSWTVCVAVGLGVCSPERALLMGLPGTLLGGLLFQRLGWPPGPMLAGHPVLPALLGTTLMLVVSAYVKRVREELRESKQVSPPRPFREWPAALTRARP